jgi:5-methylcytosine-specific restriction endonuclease McrA
MAQNQTKDKDPRCAGCGRIVDLSTKHKITMDRGPGKNGKMAEHISLYWHNPCHAKVYAKPQDILDVLQSA